MLTSLVKTISATLLVRLAGIALQLIWFMLLVRLLPLDQVGIYSAINSGWILLRALGPLGMDMLLLRESGAEQGGIALQRRFLRYIITVLLLLGFVGGGLAFWLGEFSSPLMLLSLCGALLYGLIGYLSACILAQDRPMAANAPDALGLASGVIILLGLLLWLQLPSLTLLLCGQIITAMLVVLWYGAQLWRSSRMLATQNTRSNGVPLRQYATQGLAIWSNIALNNLILRLPVMLAPWLIGAVNAALLETALRFATLLGLLHWAVSYTMMPKLARAHRERQPALLQELLTISSFLSALPTLLGFALLVLLGEPLIRLLAQPDYAAAYWPMLVIAFGISVNACSGPLAQLYNLTGKQVQARRIYAMELLLLLLMLMAAPHYGPPGAAVAVTAALLYRNAWLNFLLPRLLSLSPPVYTSAGWLYWRRRMGQDA